MAWWDENRPSAPGAVTAELDDGLARIVAGPHTAGARYRRTRLGEIRRLYLKRIHYHLYYRIGTDDIEVVAFWHASRGSAPPI